MDKKAEADQFLISEKQNQSKNGDSVNGSSQNGGHNGVNKSVQNDKNENVISSNEKEEKKVVKKGEFGPEWAPFGGRGGFWGELYALGANIC